MKDKNINTPQEIIFADMQIKNKEKTSKKHVIFHISIVLLNICMLALFWVLVSNKFGLVKAKDIVDTLDWRYIAFLCLIPICIIFLQATNDCVLLYGKTKRRRFAGVLFANQIRNLSESYSKCGDCEFVMKINSYNIDKRASVDLNYSKKISTIISKMIYSAIILILGVIVCMENMNIWMVVIGVIAFVFQGGFLCFVLYSLSHMDKCIETIAKLSKFLFKLKIVKDYEYFFKKTSSRLYEYNFVVKQLSKISVISILSDMIIMFLRHFGLFVIFQMLNFGGWDYFIWIIFSCTLFDLVFDVLPMPKGTFVFEIFFSILFVNIFFSGYLPWAMLMYRVLDYFVYIILSLIFLIFDKRGNNKIVNTNQLENEENTNV